MKAKVTIDIFSGRENPVVEFSGKRLDEFLERAKPTKMHSLKEISMPPMPTVGYRGMVVEFEGGPRTEIPGIFRLAGGRGFSFDRGFEIADEALEDFVCGSVPKEYPGLEIRKVVKTAEQIFKEQMEERLEPPIPIIPSLTCPCAPLYEPEWWNVPARQPHNNCYNYASNYLSNTFAQPGRATGHMYSSFACDPVKQGAVSDGLLDTPGADNQCPAEGHLVALVIWPNVDFHWYRKGHDTFWSHKPGSRAATNLDNSGHTIRDPRTADRGPYTQFCTFMNVRNGHIILK